MNSGKEIYNQYIGKDLDDGFNFLLSKNPLKTIKALQQCEIENAKNDPYQIEENIQIIKDLYTKSDLSLNKTVSFQSRKYSSCAIIKTGNLNECLNIDFIQSYQLPEYCPNVDKNDPLHIIPNNENPPLLVNLKSGYRNPLSYLDEIGKKLQETCVFNWHGIVEL